MKYKFTFLFLFALIFQGFAQSLEEVPFDRTWKGKIEFLAPEETSFDWEKKGRVLVFSLFTGFEHWVIPHTEEVVRVLGEKSGAFDVERSVDIRVFKLANLKSYDAIVLNNTCSERDYRNLFWDQLKRISNGDSASMMSKAIELENNLIQYVEEGGGLMVLHGGITTLNQSEKFSELLGASFDYHPPQQEIQIRLSNPNHPLVQAFPAEGFKHVDEPYFYNGAFSKGDFTSLLHFENASIKSQREGQELTQGLTPAAWIREQGDGRVMYCAPSHNAQSYDNPDLLRFFLDNLQWVAGQVSFD